MSVNRSTDDMGRCVKRRDPGSSMIGGCVAGAMVASYGYAVLESGGAF
ncbi:hypothetical protein [Mariprofundus erugo]|nr:hypothetical protein [Mariprofundus erugo]